MSYRNFWGCEIPGGAAGKVVSVEDGDRLNVCQVNPHTPLCLPGRGRPRSTALLPPES